MSETTQEILEEATDLIEQTLDEIEKIPVSTVIEYKNDPWILAGVGVIGLSIGVAVGYRLAKRYLEPKYAAIAEEEIREGKLMYRRLYKDGFETVDEAAKKLIPDNEPEAQEALEKYQGQHVEIEVQEDGLLVRPVERLVEPKVTTNVFEDVATNVPDVPGWDWDTELLRREGTDIYVVTEKEFFSNEDQWETSQVTWYEGDQVLADEQDQVITDVDGNLGGLDNLEFGKGTDQTNLVYIMNRRINHLFEVARFEGSYAKHVLNFDEDDD